MAGQLLLAPNGPLDASMIVPVVKGYNLPGYFEYVSEHERERLQLDPGDLRELPLETFEP
jgi:hypothetical protein